MRRGKGQGEHEPMEFRERMRTGLSEVEGDRWRTASSGRSAGLEPS
jgi:hypothetical protein